MHSNYRFAVRSLVGGARNITMMSCLFSPTELLWWVCVAIIPAMSGPPDKDWDMVDAMEGAVTDLIILSKKERMPADFELVRMRGAFMDDEDSIYHGLRTKLLAC